MKQIVVFVAGRMPMRLLRILANAELFLVVVALAAVGSLLATIYTHEKLWVLPLLVLAFLAIPWILYFKEVMRVREELERAARIIKAWHHHW